MNHQTCISGIAKALLLFAVLLVPRPVNGQEVAPGGGIFDFSDLDVPPAEVLKEDAAGKPPVPEEDPLAGYPDEVRMVLEKLAAFEAAKQRALNKQITEARKVAAEILSKRAANADAATRGTLLKRAGEVESLPPEQPLESDSKKKNSPALDSLLGNWKPSEHRWTDNFLADGKIYRGGQVRGQWQPLDEKLGLFYFNYDTGSVAVFQLEKPAGARNGRIVFSWGGASGVKRTDTANAPRIAAAAGANDPVTQLAANESTLRAAHDTLIQSKRSKVAAWLLHLAPKSRGEQTRLLVERAAALERKAVPGILQPDEHLGRVWQWRGKPLEFKEGGTVMVGSGKGGVWQWGRDAQKIIVFSLDEQKSGGIAYLSKDDAGVLRLRLLKGGDSEARRR